MSRKQKRIYLEIAQRWDEWGGGDIGCIERMSTVPQGNGRQGTSPMRGGARVAWRILGFCACGVDAVCGYCEWGVSCRTPPHLRGDLYEGEEIGDGSDEAAAAWVRGET